MDQGIKEKIISEYLTGGISLRDLGIKYGTNFRNIHRWVKQYKGTFIASTKNKTTTVENIAGEEENLPTDVKQLQAELRKTKLHNKLLEALLDIGKEQYNLDLRKKAGTKRS
jgi:transposase-like protein